MLTCLGQERGKKRRGCISSKKKEIEELLYKNLNDAKVQHFKLEKNGDNDQVLFHKTQTQSRSRLTTFKKKTHYIKRTFKKIVIL